MRCRIEETDVETFVVKFFSGGSKFLRADSFLELFLPSACIFSMSFHGSNGLASTLHSSGKSQIQRTERGPHDILRCQGVLKR